MPRQDSRETTFEPFRILPVGADGLNTFLDATMVAPSGLVRAENIRGGRLSLDRRGGALKLTRGTDTTGSLTFGATTKYVTVPAASQLAIPSGGWAFLLHFTATRPGSGNTGWLLSTRPSGVAWHVLSVTISDAGAVTVAWRDNGGTSRSVTTAEITADAVTHLLAVYDAAAGTFTVYLNGVSSGTPLTGLASTLYPDATSTDWVFGVEKPGGAAVTLNSQFSGAMNGATLLTLKGTRPSSGDTTLVSVLRKHSWRSWPAPEADGVLFHYDFDSISTFRDRSRFKNHGSFTGTPTLGSSVSLATLCGNVAHLIQSPDGRRTNVVGVAGTTYYETVKTATA